LLHLESLPLASGEYLFLSLQDLIRQWTDRAAQGPAAQSLVEVRDQVVGALQPDAGADDPVAGPLPDGLFLGRGQIGCRVHVQVGGVVEEQAVGVTERGGVGEELDLLGHADGRAQSAF
jgi:hypothetical protein